MRSDPGYRGVVIWFRFLIAWGGSACAVAQADELKIARTPIVQASLTTGTTWQVESSQGGGPWTPSGVLMAGSPTVASARLDGMPETSRYRLARIDGAATAIPVMSSGWHLSGIATGASQVRLDTSANLASWSQTALAFPAADGGYLRVVRQPLAVRGFFRAEVPATPVTFASCSFYPADPAEGASGFGPVADDMPTIYKDGFIAALSPTEYNRGGANAAAAGECYELTGPAGTTTVMVGELSPSAPSGTIDAGRSYFDLGTPAFQQIAGTSGVGYVAATCRLVPAPVTGNVKLLVVNNSGGFYLALTPYNYRAGITKVEIKSNSSSTWVNMPRSAANRFEYNTGTALVFPVQVRVTSRFGEIVTFLPIASMATDQRIAGTTQFTTFPALAPTPAVKMSPVYTDSFSSVPGDSWSASPYSGATVNAAFTGAHHEGSACIQLSALGGFNGVIFLPSVPFPKPEFGVLKFAMRSATATPVTTLGITFSGTNAGGASATSATVQLPPLTNAWQVFQIPMETAGMPAKITDFRLASLSAAAIPVNVWMDTISFLPR